MSNPVCRIVQDLYGKTSGEIFRIEVYRNGKYFNLLGEYSSREAAISDATILGFKVLGTMKD